MRINLGKDEEITESEKFNTNLVPWLKTDFSVTNKRIIGYRPKAILGFLPLGRDEISFPLSNVASVGVIFNFHLRRFFLGLIFMLGSIIFSGSLSDALMLLAIASIFFLSCLTNSIVVTNNAGQLLGIEISILEKKKVQRFVNKVNTGISHIT